MKRLEFPILNLHRFLLSLAGLLWFAGPGLAQYGEITVQFSSPIYYVFENGGSMTIDVVLSASSTNTVTVKYATGDGTATAGADYTTTSGTLTFAPGETSKTFAVPILPDTIVEDTEWFTVTLSEATNATISPTQGTATVTITDDDVPPPTVQFSMSGYSVSENDETATIDITLSAPSSQEVTVGYTMIDGSAKAGTDYIMTSGTVNIPAGMTSASISVQIINDTLPGEGTETFTVNLSSPTNATLGSPNSAVVYITDDDEAPSVGFESSYYLVNENGGAISVNVILSSAQQFPITLDYATSDGTALAGVDYTATSGTLSFDPGVTKLTITVPIIDKGDYSGNVVDFGIYLSNPNPSNVSITNSPATIFINDADLPPGPSVGFDSTWYVVDEKAGSVSVKVILSSAQQDPVSVDFATSDGTGLAGVDYGGTFGTLTFAPGVTSQTISIPIIDNADYTGNWVFFDIQLSNPSPGTLIISNSPATVYIVEDDSPPPAPPTVYFTATSYTFAENCGYAQIEVLMTGTPAGTVNVSYATSDGTAKAGVNYQATSGVLTWNATEAGQVRTFQVNILDDGVANSTLTLNLTLSNPSNASPGTPFAALLNILDANPVCPPN